MSIREEILNHRATRERKLAVCAGGAGLAPDERVDVLAVLSYDKEDAIAQRAAESLLAVDSQEVIAALKRAEAPEELFKYCAKNLAETPGIADAMAQNDACPAESLVEVAPYLKEAVGLLVDDLDRLSANPGLVTALAPLNLSPQQRNTLEEMQKEAAPINVPEDDDAIASVEPDKARRLSLYQRVSQMKVVERIQLALKGTRDARMLLIRDQNKVVCRAVLQSPKITDQEIEGFAAMTSLSDEVLRLISNNRRFIKNYSVVRSLVKNPKTPLDISMHLLPRLTPLDLKAVTTSKSIPETLRTTALKLQRQRTAKPAAE